MPYRRVSGGRLLVSVVGSDRCRGRHDDRWKMVKIVPRDVGAVPNYRDVVMHVPSMGSSTAGHWHARRRVSN